MMTAPDNLWRSPVKSCPGLPGSRVDFALGAEGDEPALQVGASGASGEAVSVRKSWTALPGGGAVLEESVGWEALAALGAGLPRQAGASGAAERTWRTARAERGSERRPVEVAQGPYRPAGLVVDFELSGSVYSYTFAMGQTYYIPNSFNVGPGVATFQPGCTIKFRHNAWLLAYGPVSFPDTLQTPVFTSKDDNSFGEIIKFSPDGPNYDPNDPDSDGDPSDQKAAQALWIYYLNTSTVVQNARFRWAQTAVRYDANPGVNVTHYLLNSLLEHCQTGVRNDMPDGMVSLSGVEMHAVTGPVSGPYQGSYTAPLFYTQKSFAGLNGDDGVVVPDTMGAIGLNEYLEVLNGRVAVFNRFTGALTGDLSSSDFFAPGEGRTLRDPRVWYDHASQRWVASAMDNAGDTVILKVSLSSNASLDASNWRRFVVPFTLGQNEAPDFPTLGLDANGIYLSTQIRSSGAQAGYRIVALKKPDVYTNQNYQPSAPLVVTAEELDTWCIQPAYNFDAPPVGGYAWLVAKGPASGNLGGQIFCRRLRWNGDNPEWVGNWQAVVGTYRDYYDIAQGGNTFASQSGGPAISLGYTGSRLMTAVIRNGSLWTCHHVGLDSVGGNYDGNPGWAVTRSAVQWFKLQVGTDGLTYSAHGRIYDAAWSNPYWYHFPSLNVNAAGDLLVGFSGSRATEYIGAFYRGRRANGTWMSRPVLVQAGRCPFAPLDHDRWGDYSATSVDPADGSFWTIQQYADPAPDEGEGYKEWGTWITQLRVAQ